MSLNSAQRSRLQAYKSSRRLRGVDVIYSTDDGDVPIRVIPALTSTRVEDSETRIQLKSYVRDYLILPEDLELDDEQFYPKAGHEITEGDATYEVLRDLAGEPAWRWDDEQTKQIIRVHTQLAAGT